MKFTELVPGLDRLLGGKHKRKVKLLSSQVERLAEELRQKQNAIDTLSARLDQLNQISRDACEVSDDRLTRLRQENDDLRNRLDHDVGRLDHHVGQLRDLIQQESVERQAGLQNERREFRDTLRHEVVRLDYALGEIEGLGTLRDEFIAARRTAEYQSVFDEPEPLVSICISTFNRGELLVERAIASLQAQSYRNLQIIVVGDYCTDDTAERLAALGDPRIEFHNLPSRTVYPRPGRDRWFVAGTGPAIFARTMVRGDFITALDEDDMYEPERIETVLRTAQRERADFVWHKFMWQNPDGSWREAGNGLLEYTQLGIGMCLFHKFFVRLSPDIHCYRVDEPGDWNFIRRIKHLRPTMHFIDRPLTRYYSLPKRAPLVPDPNETYLE